MWRKAELDKFLKNSFDAGVALRSGPIFVPRAVVPQEARMGLTPVGAAFLRMAGVKNEIFVEAGAGINRETGEVYFSDQEYMDAGAKILGHDAFVAQAQAAAKKIVVSIKEPQESEYPILQNALLFTYLHLADNPGLTKKLQELLFAGVAYETIAFDTPEGVRKTPVLAPASLAAGALSAKRYAVFVLGRNKKFENEEQFEKLFRASVARYPHEISELQGSLKGKKVLVLGGGVAGEEAAMDAAKLGANVLITEVNDRRIAELEKDIEREGLSARLKVLKRDPKKRLEEECREYLLAANAVIGAVLIEGAKAPVEIEHELYKEMRRAGKLEFVADIAIDQGGNVAVYPGEEYSKGYKYQDGWKAVDGKVGLFAVTNIPSALPLQVSLGLERAKMAYLVALLMGPQKAVEVFPELKNGFNIVNGQITHAKVAAAPGINAKFVPLATALNNSSTPGG